MFKKDDWKIVWQGIEYNITVVEQLGGIQIIRRNDDEYFIALVEKPISKIKVKELGLKYRHLYFVYTYQKDEAYQVVSYKNKKMVTCDTSWISLIDVLSYLYEGFGFDLENEYDVINHDN
ncbi:hypothetical protein [Halalkalibacter okhensis]|uniref:Uncharacterized protein n=1 Tax=Halalkalibacter okhensis TaxID=333138 RepID=A0A0B0ILE6_9BACI|nr:hypothetical protein [Halalkalibacter okhensis]KHF41717.1 hypothetical protein LQ50_03195 [Halalkalibacter okhensis]